MENRKLVICLLILIAMSSIASEVNTGNQCLCDVARQNCLHDVNGDIMFYVRFLPFAKNVHDRVTEKGIVQCWNRMIKPMSIAILMCDNYRQGEKFDNIGQRIQVIFNNFFQQAFSFHSEIRYVNHDYIALFNNKLGSLIILTCLSQGIDSDKPELHPNLQWLSNYTHRRILSTITNTLDSPEKVLSLHVQDVNIELLVDLLPKFTSLKHLSMLNIGLHNFPIEFLKNTTEIQVLDLSGNHLSQINEDSIADMKNLVYLKLSHNQIHATCDLVAKSRPSDVTINLSHNQISHACTDHHARIVDVYELQLTFNEIVVLDNMFHEVSGNLHWLNISHNKLEKITETDFVFLKRLKHLDLSSNHIRSIDKHAFRELEDLSWITLDDNLLDFKDNSVPYFPPNMVSFSLNNNHIEKIPFSAMKNVESVVNLNLIGNHIYHIELDDFLYLEPTLQLVSLDLRNNTITTVSQQGVSLDAFVEKTEWRIFLAGNPLRCDCTARHLHKLANIFDFTDLRCNEPLPLKNLLFVDVDENLLHCRRTDVCPFNCTCEYSRNETFVDCARGKHINIPSEIPSNATSLVMSFNPLTRIQSLKHWRSLRKLDLSNCKNLQDILEKDISSFDHLVDLQELNLKSTNLSSINQILFKNLVNLRTLNLEFNSLMAIPEIFFSSLNKLRWIFFKNNNIAHVDELALKSNPALTKLDFSFNHLQFLRFNISHLIKLTSVDFSHNFLKSIQIIWPVKVKEILLSYNKITSIDISIFPDNIHFVDLSNNGLFSIDIDSLAHFAQNPLINFTQNTISTFYSFSGSTSITNTSRYTDIVIALDHNSISCDCNLTTFLRYLNLRKLHLLDIESVHCSSPDFMTGTLVSSLDVGRLPCLYIPSLEYPVAECNFYKWNMSEHRIVECGGISKLPDVGNVTNELYLKNGSLESINQLFAENWTELQVLSSKFVVGVVNMEAASFAQMKQLTTLIFTHNTNLVFSRQVFSNLNELVELDLSFNNIAVIHTRSFDGNKNLKHLFLSHNLIEQLPGTIFSELSQLHELDLSHNRLVHLSDILFDNLAKLEILLLGGNFLNALGENLVRNCNTLRKLDLSGNSISSDVLKEFHIPYSVKNLTISKNNVTDIEESLLTRSQFDYLDLQFNGINILNLTQIDLFPTKININVQNNNISQIVWFDENLNMNYELTTSRYIQLTNNSLNCDCNLKSLIHYLKRHKNSVLTIPDSHLKCYHPEHLKNKLLTEVQDHELYCVLENCPVACECKLKATNDEKEVNCKFAKMSNLVSNSIVADSLLLENSKDLSELNTISWNMLKKLYIAACSFAETISKNFLKNHQSLNELTVRDSNLMDLPDNFFMFTPGLISIDLSYNLIRNLSSEIFLNLSKLVDLNLSNNQLVLINWQFSETLESLNIAHNEIRDLIIPKRNIHYNLKYLNVSYNKFQSMPHRPLFLYHLKRLVTLDLSHNSIAVNCDNLSSIFPMSLLNLNLSHNELNCTNLWSGTSKTASKIFHIDVSYNPIGNLYLSHFPVRNFSTVEINMSNCEIANYSFDVVKTISDDWTVLVVFDISNNYLIECDCAVMQYSNATIVKKNNLLFELQIFTPNNCSLKNLDLKVDPNFKFSNLPDTSSCIMKSKCSENCTCVKVMNEMRMFCARMGFRGLPPNSPPGLTYLNFDYNNIAVLKGLTDPEWRNLTTISLRDNRIGEISFENMSLLSSLKEIYLDGNQLRKPSGWLANFVNYKYLPVNLTLSSNPWLCDCTNELFQKWLTKFSPYHLVLDVEKMSCTDGTLLLTADICSTPLELWKILVPAVLLITAEVNEHKEV